MAIILLFRKLMRVQFLYILDTASMMKYAVFCKSYKGDGRSGHPFTVEEDDTFVNMYMEDHKFEDIATHLGLTCY